MASDIFFILVTFYVISVLQDEDIEIEAPFTFTTNILFAWYFCYYLNSVKVPHIFFSERTRDREVVVNFKVPKCTDEQLKEGSKLYEEAMNATKVIKIMIIIFY